MSKQSKLSALIAFVKPAPPPKQVPVKPTIDHGPARFEAPMIKVMQQVYMNMIQLDGTTQFSQLDLSQQFNQPHSALAQALKNKTTNPQE